jgi:hypothetical protein
VSRTKASAKCAACTSNLRQIGVGLKLYVDEFEKYPLGLILLPNGDFVRPWYSPLIPYCGSSNIFVDPLIRPTFGYWYNIIGTYPARRAGEATLGLGQLGRWGVAVPESQVVEPSDMLAMPHGDLYTGWQGFGWPGLYVPRNSSYRRDWMHPLDIALFCDGHVESSNPERIPKMAQPDSSGYIGFRPEVAYTQRWNNDHQPHPETWR